MRLHRRLTTLAAVGCLALAAAGCGGGADPAPKPSTSTSTSKPAEKAAPTLSKSSGPGGKGSQSATPSASARAKKPERSNYPRISERNSAGASATLKYFIDGYRYGLLTGDPSAVEDFSSPDCEPCMQMINKIKSDGVRLTSADWQSQGSNVNMTGAETAEGSQKISSQAILLGRSNTQSEIFYIGAQMRWSDGVWSGYNISVEGEE